VSPGVPDTVDGIGDLRQAFTWVPQPVAVLTGLSSCGGPVGMTISTLTSVSLQPPLVLFCPAVTSRAWAAVRGRGLFALNVLGQEHVELAMRFAARGNRFHDVRIRRTRQGVPALADALTVLVCAVREELPAGDHAVVLARVLAIDAHRDGLGLDTVSLRHRTQLLDAPSRRSRRVSPRPGNHPLSLSST
jgi:3-hydroxy-9,10-secoandrosta-1,3,5(10)-triene-9,17-dione monooxygenase reductase component